MKRWLVRIFLIFLALFACLVGSCFWVSNDNPFWLRNGWRKGWKNRAVADIAKRSDDSAGVAAEIARLKAGGGTRFASDSWLSSQMILMTNGDWMVYSNICRKQDFKISDLFI